MMRFYLGFYILLTTVLIKVLCDCGITAPNANPLDANIDGIEADIFPWHVVIYEKRNDGTFVRSCYGNAIGLDVVITAMKCIFKNSKNINRYYVVSGNYAPSLIESNITIQKTRVKSYNTREEYNSLSGYHFWNIASLVLEHPLNVTPACINLENQQDTEQLPVGLIGQVFYRPSLEAKSRIRSMKVLNNSHRYCKLLFEEVERHNISLHPPCVQLLRESQPFDHAIGSGLYSQHDDGRWYLRAIITDNLFNDPFAYNDDIRHYIPLMMNVQHFTQPINRSGAIKTSGCGMTGPPVHPLIVKGFEAEIGRYPWHVGIYRKNSAGLYVPICAGSLISTEVVLSAAHCFFDEVRRRQENVSDFAVAGGKFYRLYERPEKFAQKSLIKTIHLPERYNGVVGNYAEDIAWIILQHPFYYSALVTPVCIDFNNSHENEDLRDGRVGKIAGWGKTAADVPSNELQETDLPFIPYDKCISALPQDFQPFVTSDKFCAGYLNGTRLCDGDSGGGLVFNHGDIWYLRGIVSVGPPSVVSTCAASYTVFTDVGHFNDEHRRTMNISTRGSD